MWWHRKFGWLRCGGNSLRWAISIKLLFYKPIVFAITVGPFWLTIERPDEDDEN